MSFNLPSYTPPPEAPKSVGSYLDKAADYIPGLSTVNVILNLAELAIMKVSGVKNPKSAYLKQVLNKPTDHLIAAAIPFANLAILVKDVRDYTRGKSVSSKAPQEPAIQEPAIKEKSPELVRIEALAEKARAGDLDSMYLMGLEYLKPNNVIETDSKQAMQLFSNAAKAGHTPSKVKAAKLNFEKSLELRGSNLSDPQIVARELQKNALKDIEEVANRTPDPSRGPTDLENQAIDQANSLLCTLTLQNYTSQLLNGLPRFEQAVNALEKTSDPNVQQLYLHIAQICESGSAYERNPEIAKKSMDLAIKCYEEASRRGYKDASLELVRIYNDGAAGHEPDPQKAYDAAMRANSQTLRPSISNEFKTTASNVMGLAAEMKNKNTKAYEVLFDAAAVQALSLTQIINKGDLSLERNSDGAQIVNNKETLIRNKDRIRQPVEAYLQGVQKQGKGHPEIILEELKKKLS